MRRSRRWVLVLVVALLSPGQAEGQRSSASAYVDALFTLALGSNQEIVQSGGFAAGWAWGNAWFAAPPGVAIPAGAYDAFLTTGLARAESPRGQALSLALAGFSVANRSADAFTLQVPWEIFFIHGVLGAARTQTLVLMGVEQGPNLFRWHRLHQFGLKATSPSHNVTVVDQVMGTKAVRLTPGSQTEILFVAAAQSTITPEPATLALMGSGLAGLAGVRRRRRPKQS